MGRGRVGPQFNLKPLESVCLDGHNVFQPTAQGGVDSTMMAREPSHRRSNTHISSGPTPTFYTYLLSRGPQQQRGAEEAFPTQQGNISPARTTAGTS